MKAIVQKTRALQEANLRSGYPHTPGYRTLGTSSEAAHAISDDARSLRARVLRFLTSQQHRGYGSEQIALRLGEDKINVRSRLSELHRDRLIEMTGERCRNVSGKSANCWRVPFEPEDGL